MRRVNGIHGLILDYGEVLCHRPGPEKIVRMADALKLDPETFAARYEQGRGLYDRGDLSFGDYWSAVSAGSVPLDYDLFDQLRRWDVEMWIDVDPDMTEWVGRVQASGLKTAVLSNMHVDMAAYARRTFTWMNHLDSLTLSCEVRLIKPERAIYERCLEGVGLRPEQALFIDDREANVLAAREAGLRALRFESIERLRSDLEGLGIRVLPAVRPS
ncbi:MAG TPA: HAD family phosphatase [Bryobacteraceae bacterium]|nr:HAD family phosphatase [Bryobacteraceae bacterium]